MPPGSQQSSQATALANAAEERTWWDTYLKEYPEESDSWNTLSHSTKANRRRRCMRIMAWESEQREQLNKKAQA